MARRTRTAKTRAQRIDMSYFKRRHPLRRWRFVLSYLAAAGALIWVGGLAGAGSKTPYSSGPLAAAHAVFGDQCVRCHVTAASTFRSHVTDQACLACHDAPAHTPLQTTTPACATCHLDHRGPVGLAAVDDRSCGQCHQRLAEFGGGPTVAAMVGSFSSSHPEFAAKRPGTVDMATVRFNHAVHLKADLPGPDGPARLACTTCHAPDAPRGGSRDAGGGRLTPVTYARNCASCHPLHYDPLIEAQAPHKPPALVRDSVVGALSAFIEANPSYIGTPDRPQDRIPINFPEPPPAVAANAAEWIEARTVVAERYLWAATCTLCHVVERPDLATVTIVPPAVPTVWMPRARFDHRPHRLASCDTCHDAALTSRETSDVLLPSIATCRACHKPNAGAESRCFECHDYHEWAKTKPSGKGFDLRQLVK